MAACVASGILGSAKDRDLDVHVEGHQCLAESEIRSALVASLNFHRAEVLSVTIVEAVSGSGFAATLRVVSPLGDVILERRFALEDVDCASVPALLRGVLDTFLTQFPREKWEIPAKPPERPTIVINETGVGALVHLGSALRLVPASADVEIGAGTRNRCGQRPPPTGRQRSLPVGDSPGSRQRALFGYERPRRSGMAIRQPGPLDTR